MKLDTVPGATVVVIETSKRTDGTFVATVLRNSTRKGILCSVPSRTPMAALLHAVKAMAGGNYHVKHVKGA